MNISPYHTDTYMNAAIKPILPEYAL